MDPNPQQLPSTLHAWRNRKPYNYPEEWYKPWEHLRSFFLECGYDLFRPRSGGLLSISNGTRSPALDSFGLYGNRSDEFRSSMGRVSTDFLSSLAFSNHFLQYPVAFAARDRLNLCSFPVIRLISCVQGEPRCSHQTSCKRR